MKKYIINVILILLIILAAFLNYLPHLNYDYPLHVDEWVHFQYSNNLSTNSPLYFPESKTSLEQGFHLILATLNVLGINYLSMFKFFPVLIITFICISVFILARKIFNEKAALFSVLFIALLQSNITILGPLFLVPMSLGLLLILIGLYLLEINSNVFFLPLAALLIIHPPSALAYFLIINLNIAIKRKQIFKKLYLQALAFLISLPIYLPTFLQNGVDTLDKLNFIIISSPLFIPRLLGYFITLLIGIGIYFSIYEKRRYDLIIYTIVFLILIAIFYYLEIEVFLPYRRTLMYLFLIFALLFGFGCSQLINISDKKSLKVIILIFMLLLILIFSLPQKIESTQKIYHIIDEKDYNSLTFIKKYTPKDVIVIADPWISNAITPIAERSVFSRIVQGPNVLYESRNSEINYFFVNKCSDTNFLTKNNISIIYSATKCDNKNLEMIYQGVYSVKS